MQTKELFLRVLISKHQVNSRTTMSITKTKHTAKHIETNQGKHVSLYVHNRNNQWRPLGGARPPLIGFWTPIRIAQIRGEKYGGGEILGGVPLAVPFGLRTAERPAHENIVTKYMTVVGTGTLRHVRCIIATIQGNCAHKTKQKHIKDKIFRDFIFNSLAF